MQNERRGDEGRKVYKRVYRASSKLEAAVNRAFLQSSRRADGGTAQSQELTTADCQHPGLSRIRFRSQRGPCHASEGVQSSCRTRHPGPAWSRQRSRCAQCGGDARGAGATAAASLADRATVSGMRARGTRREAPDGATQGLRRHLYLGSARGGPVWWRSEGRQFGGWSYLAEL